MIQRVIFDWSGTLCDDRWLTLQATNLTLVHFGAEPVDEATYQRDFRLPIENFYQPRIGQVDRETIDQVFFDNYRQLASESGLFANAELLIRMLHWRGLTLGIVSTMAGDILESLLRSLNLRDQFEFVRGDAADKIPVLTEIGAQAAGGIGADQTLYIGDMVHDIEAAKAAGMISGAALYGYSELNDLDRANPDHRYKSIDAILSQLDREQLLAHERRVIATVGGILISERGRLLLNRTEKWSNKYGLPGGKIDYGETMSHAFEREVLEETGMQLSEHQWLTTQDAIEHPQFRERRHFLLINYIGRVSGEPVPKSNYEAQELAWYSLGDALALDLNQPTRAALELALEHPWLKNIAEEKSE